MRIRELRELNNIQQKALAGILGISSNTLSQYENGKRVPGIEIVSKIANYFNVSTDYIYGLSETATCSQCGLSYCPDVALDRETHKQIHAKWLKAKEKYGFCFSNYGERERIKANGRNIVSDTSLPLQERYNAQINVFKCLFSRSLEASDYSDSHVDFDTYIAMLLNQNSVKQQLDMPLYEKLVSEFGTKPGIEDGRAYYDAYKVSSPTTFAAHFDGNDYTEEEMNEIMQFAEYVKSKRK